MLLLLLFGVLICGSSGLNLAGIPLDLSVNDTVLSEVADDVANKIVMEYRSYLKSGIKSTALKQISTQMSNSNLSKDIFRKDTYELEPRQSVVACITCRSIARVIVDLFRAEEGEMNKPGSDLIAKRVMLEFCEMFNLQTEEVCGGLFDTNWDTIEYIIRNSEIDSKTFCSLFLQFNFCNVDSPDYDWELDIDKNGPVINGPKTDFPGKSQNDLHILHLTDVHHDPLYMPGTLAECAEPICCQRHKEFAQENPEKAAGYWGDYRDCDPPWHSVEDALQHIKATHSKIDFIYQTGDIIDHMVWNTSFERNNQILTKMSDALEQTFPNIKVYPCIGNHEPHPLNAFSPPDAPDHVSTRRLYEHLYNDWSRWLPESTKETILTGGYYTVTPKPGFRIISLNNNDCYIDNWWIFHRGTDAQAQLLWLHDTLLEAEENGENVHILAHIPSGDGSCWITWSREYNRIIERFNHIISGIFNGHSHKDEMNVHYSRNGHAIGISWNGGSLTTFSFKNPNYRMYEVEPKTMQVVDHETWIYNLTEANLKAEKSPNWFKEYTFSEEFTSDLSPAGLDKLLDSMAENPNLLRKFWRYKMTTADPKIKDGCGRSCLMSTICRLATTVSKERKRCNELERKLAVSLDNETTTPAPTSPSSPTTTSTTSTTTTAPTVKPPPGEPDVASGFTISLTTLLALLLLLKCIS